MSCRSGSFCLDMCRYLPTIDKDHAPGRRWSFSLKTARKRVEERSIPPQSHISSKCIELVNVLTQNCCNASPTDMQFIICALPLRFLARRRKTGPWPWVPVADTRLKSRRLRGDSEAPSKRANLSNPRRASAKPGDKVSSKFIGLGEVVQKNMPLSRRRFIHRVSIGEGIQTALCSDSCSIQHGIFRDEPHQSAP